MLRFCSARHRKSAEMSALPLREEQPVCAHRVFLVSILNPRMAVTWTG